VITDGTAEITGLESVQKARELARNLNAGALPIPIQVISQENVGASLGQESLNKSLTAGTFGLILVAVFMFVLYLTFGLIAVFSLALYAVLLISVYKILGITLTLSGIAGLILSLGMAVDANILIFERVKEEIRQGRPLREALDNGFKKAWSSIRDGNLSTIITCVILILFGSGLVKGFAIALLLGILLSLFTAVIVTRNLLEFTSKILKTKMFFGLVKQGSKKIKKS
ncbi:MAG: protein translocase subunit SecD, partial [Candidatus Moranbacteria bacterium]|nr:protein translocase subunit SecD [Candidatus Moranbacteria bacterium]